MGGIAILLGLVITYPFFINSVHMHGGTENHPSYPGLFPVLILTIAYALIGFVDDLLTMRPRNGKRGLSSKMKFGLQFVAATAFALWLSHIPGFDSTLRLGNWFYIDLGWTYIPFAVLFITGMANFINITDGLDGLAAGLIIILALTLAASPFLFGMVSNDYSIVLLTLAGACAAFLWFNFNPAKVFMGDTGSLAIGALIPALALVMKMEVFMVIAGMVFILDGLSSAVQWAVFKYTRIRTGTGRRVFKMSPIHHHFELSGIPEQSVVVRFWIVGGLFGLLAILLAIMSQLK
jgi:phospho-N-acetylmuramoyl-pentapeptide-transferase